MRTALHLVRVDVRRWWLLVLAWIALVALDTVFSELGPVLAVRQPSTAPAMDALALLLPVLRVLMACLLVSAVVHDTPLVGSTAFWMTRPIAIWPLLVSKAITLVGLLVVLPAIADAAALTYRGFPAGLIAVDTIEALFGFRLLALLLLLVIAAVTAGTTSFAITLVAVLAAATLSLVVAAVIMLNSWPGGRRLKSARRRFRTKRGRFTPGCRCSRASPSPSATSSPRDAEPARFCSSSR